jgi:TRAP-type transport system periplasmic protein
MKIRTMENPIHLRAFEALGAAPTPMSFAELFTALQQGVVDAQENPIVVISVSNFAEVQSHLSLTGHLYSPAIIMMSQASGQPLRGGAGLGHGGGAPRSRSPAAASPSSRRPGVDGLIEKGMEVVTDVDKPRRSRRRWHRPTTPTPSASATS